jgi:hypothetical protein
MANQEAERSQNEKSPQELFVQFEGRSYKKSPSGLFIPVEETS